METSKCCKPQFHKKPILAVLQVNVAKYFIMPSMKTFFPTNSTLMDLFGDIVDQKENNSSFPVRSWLKVLTIAKTKYSGLESILNK